MAKSEKLTIHKISFNIQVNDKNAFKHFADRFSRMCDRMLPRKIDTLLQKYDLPNGKLVIHKLDLNLGEIRHHLFEDTICNSIISNLDRFLSRYVTEIESELTQAKFQSGRTFTISHRLFKFESVVYHEQPVAVKRLVQADSAREQYSLSSELFSEDVTQEKELRSLIAQAENSRRTSLLQANVAEQDKTTIATDIETTQLDPKMHQVLMEGAGLEDKRRHKGGHNEKETYNSEPQKVSQVSDADDTTVRKEIKVSLDRKKKKINILQQVLDLEHIPSDLPPKALSELDKAFLYFIRYGRLPSNIKYELGMNMLDVFNVNQKDIRFFNEIKKHIARDKVAKERLIKLTDEKNQKSLIRKNIFEQKEVEAFDPKIPRAFEDYFIALVLDRDTSEFSEELKRYNLNDMIRFFYADSPLKLRAILTFLLKGELSETSLLNAIEKLFSKIGKASIVKIIGSFVRKAGHVNKALNRLNRQYGKSVKATHALVLEALLARRDPVVDLQKAGFSTEEFFGASAELDIAPRVFLKPEPEYSIREMSSREVLDYFLTYGTLPHSISKKVPSIERLSILILMMAGKDIADLPYFKNKLYESNFRYQSIGQLSQKAIDYLIASLAPLIVEEVKTKAQYFAMNIKDGVPESFQKTFALYYALRNKPVSYLEEMILFWKKTFGDDGKIIRRRWKVTDEVQKEMGKILHFKEESLADQMKVDYEFQSYSKDISVKNAGLVILWPFLKPYFNMLDLLDPRGDFRSIEERARACHLLQYLAVKQSGGEEFYYPLNKILTGYPIDEPLPYEIKMTDKEIDVSNALLLNVVKQWNALKGSSVDALRGSFLIRDGVLTTSTNGWQLTVEKKAYDILLDKLPWGIGMIKLSWAPYVLAVEWERNIM